MRTKKTSIWVMEWRSKVGPRKWYPCAKCGWGDTRKEALEDHKLACNRCRPFLNKLAENGYENCGFTFRVKRFVEG